jgi:hypothetical protein
MAKSAEPVVGQPTQDEQPPTNLGGRPLKFKSVEELQSKIDAYFFDCDPHPEQAVLYKWHEIEETYETVVRGKPVQKTHMVTDHSRPPEQYTEYRLSAREPYSVTGLALALDTSRKVLLDYEDGKYDIKPGDDGYDPLNPKFSNTIKKAKAKIEHDVQRRLETNAVAGTIFNLKNNFGWVDRIDTDVTSDGEKLMGVGLSADQAEQLIRARTNRSDI